VLQVWQEGLVRKISNFQIQEASEFIASEYGMDTLYMFYENAEAIINGQVCFKDTPDKVKKKKFLGIF